MYHRIEEVLRMTNHEASERYPDFYILMQMDNMRSQSGAVLYIGDDQQELFSLLMSLDTPYCGVIEGLNHQRSLGGIVVGS